jgi:high-affinity iron transporter
MLVFRETLEASLFVGIVAAATKGLPKRSRWIFAGVVLGMIGSLLLAGALNSVVQAFDGDSIDWINSFVLLLAWLMLAWHCIWVTPNGKQMATQARQIGHQTFNGMASLGALTMAVAFSVLREGAETVMFVTGLLSGAPLTVATLLTGVVCGVLLGAGCGGLLYLGLSRIRPQILFGFTNTWILLLTGCMASQLARVWGQAGWVAMFSDQAWDISTLIGNESIPGLLLRGLVGFDANPSQLQVLFYLASVLLVAALSYCMKLNLKNQTNKSQKLNEESR